MAIETLTLGGGCFWCLDHLYRRIRGMKQVTSGYSGGQTKNPQYELVCSGNTGHAEVVQLQFDNKIVSHQALLEIFFCLHDPTTLNRQGADVGTHYRSIIFYHTEAQRDAAQRYKTHLQNTLFFDQAIVTEIHKATLFYAAESYHQDYFNNHPSNHYCQLSITPKLKKLTTYFSELLD